MAWCIALGIELASTLPASAAVGILDYRGCISGSAGVPACVTAPQDGMHTLSDLELSADGKNAYTTSEDADAISFLRRDPTTGGLLWGGCLTTDTRTNCTQLPSSVNFGIETPLDRLLDAAVSSDGKNVYAASGDSDAVVWFDRSPTTGALVFAGCITSNTAVDACAQIPDAATDGEYTGLNGAAAVVVSADGEHVYSAASASGFGRGDAVAMFSRDTGTGDLTYGGCLSGQLPTVGCDYLPNATPEDTTGPLGGARQLELSADGDSLYVAAEHSATVTHVDVDASTGGLTFGSCISSRAAIAGCASTPTGVLGPLEGVGGLAEGPEGETLYATARAVSALTTFSRESTTGELTFVNCHSGDSRIDLCNRVPGATWAGIDGPFEAARSPQVSADGTWVYLAGMLSSSIARFVRDPATGELRYADCLSSNTDVAACDHTADAAPDAIGTALRHADALALSANQRHLYAGAFLGYAISGFDRIVPDNRVRILDFHKNRRKGKGRLKVGLPSPGRVILDGAKLKRDLRSADEPKQVRLGVEPTPRVKRRLRRRGRARVLAEVRFLPDWGIERTVERRFRLVWRD